MRVLKNVERKNFKVDVYEYTYEQLKRMTESRTIFILDRITHEPHTLNQLYVYEFEQLEEEYMIIVFAQDCKTINVEYDKEYNKYNTVVTTNTGEKVKVIL